MSTTGKARTPIESTIERIKVEETIQQRFLNRAALKFAGSAVFGGLAAGGAAALVVARSKVEGPAAAWGAAECLLTFGGIRLFGKGMVDRSEAADASRKSAQLMRALAEEELAAGELIGPGSEPFRQELAALELDTTETPAVKPRGSGA